MYLHTAFGMSKQELRDLSAHLKATQPVKTSWCPPKRTSGITKKEWDDRGRGNHSE